MAVTSPPPPLPPPPSTPPPSQTSAEPTRVVNARPKTTLVGLLAVAVLFELAVTTALEGWAVLAATAAMIVVLVATPTRAVPARVVLAAALAPALFLALRASPWLLVLDALAVFLLLVLGASMSAGADLFDTRVGTLTRRTGSILHALLLAPTVIVDAVVRARAQVGGRRSSAYGGVLRGLVITVPLVAVLGLMLASGDAVFASFLRIDLTVFTAWDLVFWLIVGLWLAAGLLVHAERAKADEPAKRHPLIGPVEGAVVLAGLIAVYALFALARLLASLRGNDYVLETTGLTYAEYARSGFFQLLAAAAITVATLGALQRAVDLPDRAARRTFAILSVLAIALTLVMVQSAILRLTVYDDVFGLTALRWYSTVFAWWLGGVLVLVGLALCGMWRQRSWLPGSIATSALLILLVVNLLNPEQLIVERNLARVASTGRFDAWYNSSLSDDAVPVLVDRLDELNEGQRATVVERLCAAARAPASPSLNLARQAGDAARAELVCPAGP